MDAAGEGSLYDEFKLRLMPEIDTCSHKIPTIEGVRL
jgi:hypothetical protein